MLPIPKTEIWPYASKGKQKAKKGITCKSSWAPLSYKHALSSSPYFFWSRLITEYNTYRPTVLKIWLYGISFKTKKLSICSQHLVNRSTSSKYKCPQSSDKLTEAYDMSGTVHFIHILHGTLADLYPVGTIILNYRWETEVTCSRVPGIESGLGFKSRYLIPETTTALYYTVPWSEAVLLRN